MASQKVQANIELRRDPKGFRAYFNGLNVAHKPSKSEDAILYFTTYVDAANALLDRCLQFFEESKPELTEEIVTVEMLVGTPVIVTDECPNPVYRGYAGRIVAFCEGQAQVEFAAAINNRNSHGWVRLDHLEVQKRG